MAREEEACKLKPHVVCIPVPFQSHINAMLQLAKLLHCNGFRITFVNTEFNHHRLIKARSDLDFSSGDFSDFKFESIGGSLPVLSSEQNASQDAQSILEAIRNEEFLHPFCRLLAKLNDTTSITCIISDNFMPFTIKAAEEIGLPIVQLVITAACSFMGMMQLPALKEKGLTPLKNESHLTKEYLDTVLDWIPGMNNNVRIRDLPNFMRTTNPDDTLFNLSMESADKSFRASSIIIHTFQALEPHVLDGLSSMFSPHQLLFPIGPLQLLLKKASLDSEIRSLGCDLWKPETECIQWLDSQKPGSVIYVNFGSLTVFTKEQVVELGMGLVNSDHPFLWIIRSDLVTGNSGAFPAEFMAEIKQKGFISGWCPQEEVLNHRAVAGFLSHCGWSSTMECICAGKPMICWPISGDQQMNARYACTEWGFGMDVSSEDDDDGCVKRHEIEKVVRELMEGDKGDEMRNKAMEWKKMAEEATHASSSVNLQNLVNQLLSTHSENTTH